MEQRLNYKKGHNYRENLNIQERSLWLRLIYWLNTKLKVIKTQFVLTLQTGKSDFSKNILNTNIQGDSGGICTTLGNDSMSDSKQKSSYEHGSDFERFRS